MRRVSMLLALALTLSTTGVTGVARAEETSIAPPEEGHGMKSPGHLLDRSDQQRSNELSFFAGLPWYFGYGFPLGVGGRFYFPIIKNGFIPALNDEFGLEAGLDFTAFLGYYGGFSGDLGIPAEAMWRFHFSPKFDAYVKLGIGLGFAFGSYAAYYSTGLWVHPYPVSAVGIFYKITDTLSLRAELGYPWAKIGIGIAL